MDARTAPRRKGRPAGVVSAAPEREGSELKLEKVHDAIDVVGEVFTKYSGLLTAATWFELTPVIQHN